MNKIEPGYANDFYNMEEYETDYDEADAIAEAYEGGYIGGCTGGGKRPRVKQTVGRQRNGGVAWGTTKRVCPKGCAKKCCVK